MDGDPDQNLVLWPCKCFLDTIPDRNPASIDKGQFVYHMGLDHDLDLFSFDTRVNTARIATSIIGMAIGWLGYLDRYPVLLLHVNGI